MPFNLRDNRDERREFEAREKRERQKEYNKQQKHFAKIVGENLASYALLLILALLIGFIWTDMGLFTSFRSFIGDAVVTVILYILADICASHIGEKGGKLDEDYIKDHEEYLDLRETVRKRGITLLDAFCDWQTDVEYEYYLRTRCKELKIDYKEYMSEYYGKTLEEIQAMLPMESVRDRDARGKVFGTLRNAKATGKAAKVFALNQIKQIELTPDILMTDGKVRSLRGGVPMPGEEYIEKHTTSPGHIIMTALFAIVAAIPTFSLIQDVSVGMVIYTIFKITLMLYRMYQGYSRGAKGFNSVEPKHLQAKIKYLYLYIEFLDKKIYLELADRYDIVGISAEPSTVATAESEAN